ncbi:LysE family translocator [Roseovarius aestuariivivens]|uniref:LysE family translocator n=1 Tax=Roseovarius aestuariivivens TaxID=1888910 RepID=UPI0010819F21|nr:LysE family transporter [Roseovarius aestuariivivens]
MEAGHLIAFNLTLLAAMAAPGPALLFAIRQSVVGGFRAGFATGAGLGLVAAGWTGAALLGLGAVFALVPVAYTVLKLLGALYLIWLAWGMWRDARSPIAQEAAPGKRAFLGGVLVNLSNPKSVLFAASVLLVIFPAGLSVTDKALIVLNHFLVELVVYACVAAILASPPARAGYLRLKPVLDRAAALVLGALGLRLLFDRT